MIDDLGNLLSLDRTSIINQQSQINNLNVGAIDVDIAE